MHLYVYISVWICLLSGVVCPPPKEVDRGHLVAVQRTEYEVGDTIYYLCKKTFLLDGPNQVTCLPNGTWSAEPACRGKRSWQQHNTFSQSWLCWTFALKIFIFLDVRFGMFLFPAVNHKPPFLFVMTNISHHSLPLSFRSARCPVPAQRSRVIVGGIKRWPYDLTDGVVAHGENVTFFCKHPEKLCSFTATEVCVDGQLKAPSCFLGTQLQPHLYTL